MTHQQFGRLLGNLTDPLHIDLGRRGGLDLLKPVGSVIEGQILFEGFTAIQLSERDRSDHGVISQTRHLLFHGGIHEIEIGHQRAVAPLIDHTFQKATHKTCVFSHGVRLLRSFTELGSESDGHGKGP